MPDKHDSRLLFAVLSILVLIEPSRNWLRCCQSKLATTRRQHFDHVAILCSFLMDESIDGISAGLDFVDRRAGGIVAVGGPT